jgi:peptidoglycan hydrolase FlgJ
VTQAVGAGLAADARGVDALRATAARDPKAAIKEAAKQFEALFMRELMKSMRQATQSSGMLDNTQFAQQMTGLRGGLSEAIARHLERQLGVAPGATDNAADNDSSATAPTPRALAPLRGSAPTSAPLPELSATQIGFVQQHAQAAREAEQSSGIPANFMIAQAAHESGWGQHQIRHADGRSAHNLFGIKAGAGWKGDVAEVTTTEVIDGQAHKVKAKFRAYASDAESFNDYARFVGDNPRYSRALAQSGSAQGFAQELQRAGYATDPHYADKLTRTINTTLRVQRAVG